MNGGQENPFRAGFAESQVDASGEETRASPGGVMPQSNNRVFHTVMAGVALVAGVLTVLGLRWVQITVRLDQLLPGVCIILLPLLGVIYYRWRREAKLHNLCAMTFWALLFLPLTNLPMFIAARQRVEPCDALLARMDSALGYEAATVVGTIRDWPFLDRVLEVCYDALLLLIFLAIVVPPLYGRMDRSKMYGISCLASVIICFPLFLTFQAVGPWAYYNYTPSMAQGEYVKVFTALKTQGRFVVDLTYHYGLITFPSFHTVLAILAAFALRPIPYLRWPATVLASLVVLATLTTGWHYLIDVVAGIGVATVAVGVAKGFAWIESRTVRPTCRKESCPKLVRAQA